MCCMMGHRGGKIRFENSGERNHHKVRKVIRDILKAIRAFRDGK